MFVVQVMVADVVVRLDTWILDMTGTTGDAMVVNV